MPMRKMRAVGVVRVGGGVLVGAGVAALFVGVLDDKVGAHAVMPSSSAASAASAKNFLIRKIYLSG